MYRGGVPDNVGMATLATPGLFKIVGDGRKNYSQKTGLRFGDPSYRAVAETYEKINDAMEILIARSRERQAKANALAEAEFDALPENEKLARKLRSYCDNHEAAIASMPIDLLRGVTNWIDKREK